MIPVESSTMYGKSVNLMITVEKLLSYLLAEVWVTLKEEIQTYRGSNINYVTEDMNIALNF